MLELFMRHPFGGMAPVVGEVFALLAGVNPQNPPWWWFPECFLEDSRYHRELHVLHIISPPTNGTAWEQWWLPRWRKGYQIAYRILGNHGDACDAVSTALLRIHAVPHSPEEFDRYFYTAVKTRAYDILRRRTRQAECPIDDVASSFPIQTLSPERQAMNAESDGRVRRAVSSLPPLERQAITLHYFKGLTVPEVAAATHTDTMTVNNRLARGRRLLRAKLADTLPDRWIPDRLLSQAAREHTRS